MPSMFRLLQKASLSCNDVSSNLSQLSVFHKDKFLFLTTKKNLLIYLLQNSNMFANLLVKSLLKSF